MSQATIKSDALEYFRNAVEDLVYGIEYNQEVIEKVKDFGISGSINHNSTGMMFFDSICKLRFDVSKDLIKEFGDNFSHGFKDQYLQRFNAVYRGLVFQERWIVDPGLLKGYKEDFLSLDQDGTIFNKKAVDIPEHHFPFKSLIYDLLYGIREIRLKLYNALALLEHEAPQSVISNKNESEVFLYKTPQKVIALYFYYLSQANEGKAINVSNKNMIAATFGHTSTESGTKLKNHFNDMHDYTTRVNISHDKRSDNTKRERFNAVIEMLKNGNHAAALKLAESECSNFMAQFNKIY